MQNTVIIKKLYINEDIDYIMKIKFKYIINQLNFLQKIQDYYKKQFL